MLILGDEGHYHGRFPWVTASLVVINVAVYVAQVMLGPGFTLSYALVPGELPMLREIVEAHHHGTAPDLRGPNDRPKFTITNGPSLDAAPKFYCPSPVLTLFTSLFLHADIFHLIGNMWFLLVFGRNVECAMNHGLFFAFYLTCGVAAGLAHSFSDVYSIIPCIGASGAISGIMGAYISIHPFNKIKVWLFIAVLEVPALIVIGLWFVQNYVSAMLSLEVTVNNGGVAYWAHLGGFVAGFVILRMLILCLQWKHRAAGPAGKPMAAAKNDEADPFATFMTVQTVRKIREQQSD